MFIFILFLLSYKSLFILGHLKRCTKLLGYIIHRALSRAFLAVSCVGTLYLPYTRPAKNLHVWNPCARVCASYLFKILHSVIERDVKAILRSELLIHLPKQIVVESQTDDACGDPAGELPGELEKMACMDYARNSRKSLFVYLIWSTAAPHPPSLKSPKPEKNVCLKKTLLP